MCIFLQFTVATLPHISYIFYIFLHREIPTLAAFPHCAPDLSMAASRLRFARQFPEPKRCVQHLRHAASRQTSSCGIRRAGYFPIAAAAAPSTVYYFTGEFILRFLGKRRAPWQNIWILRIHEMCVGVSFFFLFGQNRHLKWYDGVLWYGYSGFFRVVVADGEAADVAKARGLVYWKSILDYTWVTRVFVLPPNQHVYRKYSFKRRAFYSLS